MHGQNQNEMAAEWRPCQHSKTILLLAVGARRSGDGQRIILEDRCSLQSRLSLGGRFRIWSSGILKTGIRPFEGSGGSI